MAETTSILTSIKKLLGLTEDDTSFDTDITIHINSAFMILNQLGVGPLQGFSISDKSATWEDYLGTDKNFESIKTYVYLKTRVVFDPPTSSTLLDALTRNISELEWRLQVAADLSTTTT